MISALKDLTIKVTFSFAMFYTFAKKCDLESSCEEMCINAHIYIRDFLSEADIFDYQCKCATEYSLDVDFSQ